ncbi:hypothetical protein GGI06_006667, partial [Coemansia sp. S85]
SLDLTIVTTAIPKISQEFSALSEATWIATAYMLTTTALQPLYGRLSDTFGRVPSLIVSILVFIAGSAVCGWAQSMGVLIFGRALQGVGGAGLVALVFIIISDVTSEEERPAYLGVLGAPQGSFWEKIKRVDFLGSAVLIGAVVMLLLALTWGGKDFPWSSARVICLLIFGIIMLGVFLLIEWKTSADPTVPIPLFRIRNVSLSVLGQFFMGVGMFCPMFFIPI